MENDCNRMHHVAPSSFLSDFTIYFFYRKEMDCKSMIRRMIGDLLADNLDPTANLPAVCPIPAGGSLFGRFENRKTRTAIPIPAASKWRVFFVFCLCCRKRNAGGQIRTKSQPATRGKGLRVEAAPRQNSRAVVFAKKNRRERYNARGDMVGMEGLEPPTSSM